MRPVDNQNRADRHRASRTYPHADIRRTESKAKITTTLGTQGQGPSSAKVLEHGNLSPHLGSKILLLGRMPIHRHTL